MKLKRKFEYILDAIIAVSVLVVLGVLVGVSDRSTFAEGETGIDVHTISGAKYVTFYDGEEKLTVKTEAHTIAEAISRADIVLNVGDVVEQSMDT
jgi:uncharacterized protein YabE (DUF348 family)